MRSRTSETVRLLFCSVSPAPHFFLKQTNLLGEWFPCSSGPKEPPEGREKGLLHQESVSWKRKHKSAGSFACCRHAAETRRRCDASSLAGCVFVSLVERTFLIRSLRQSEGGMFWLTLLAGIVLVLYFVWRQSAKMPLVLYCSSNKWNQKVHQNIAELSQPFRPLWWTLGNAHAQSIVNVFLRRPAKVSYRRDLVQLHDGGQLALDWAETTNDPALSKTVLVMTGYTGSSEELEIKILVKQLLDDGFVVAVMHFRGLGNTELKTVKFGDCPPEDVQDVILHMEKSHLQKHKNRQPLIGFGVSAGANCMSLYAGWSAARCRLDALISVSNPFVRKRKCLFMILEI